MTCILLCLVVWLPLRPDLCISSCVMWILQGNVTTILVVCDLIVVNKRGEMTLVKVWKSAPLVQETGEEL